MGRLTKAQKNEKKVMFFKLKISHTDLLENYDSFDVLPVDIWTELLLEDFDLIQYSKKNFIKKHTLRRILSINPSVIDKIVEYYPSIILEPADIAYIINQNLNGSVVANKEVMHKLLKMNKKSFPRYMLGGIISRNYACLDNVIEYFGADIEENKHKLYYISKIMLCAGGYYDFDNLSHEELCARYNTRLSFINYDFNTAYDSLLKQSATNHSMKVKFLESFLCVYDGMVSKYGSPRTGTSLFGFNYGGSELLTHVLDENFTEEDIANIIDVNNLCDFGVEYFCHRQLIRIVDFNTIKNKSVLNKLLYQMSYRMDDPDFVGMVQWNTIKSKKIIETLFYYLYDLGFTSAMADISKRLGPKLVNYKLIRKYNIYVY